MCTILQLILKLVSCHQSEKNAHIEPKLDHILLDNIPVSPTLDESPC